MLKNGEIDNIYGLGLCYLFSQDLTFDQNMGIDNPIPPCANYPTERDHAEYGVCQAGTGAFMTEVRVAVILTVGYWDKKADKIFFYKCVSVCKFSIYM